MPLGLSQGIVTFTLGRRSNYHWRKARWHASNAPGFIPGDRYLHARAKAKYHWRKARWHASNTTGFTPGDRYLHARAKVNYHWHKARRHASNAPGFTPSCLPVSFDLAPLALVSGLGGENARRSCKSIGISSRACPEMWVKRRRCPPGYRIPSLRDSIQAYRKSRDRTSTGPITDCKSSIRPTKT